MASAVTLETVAPQDMPTFRQRLQHAFTQAANEAFPDFPDRLKIIAGEAEVTPEKARKIMDEIYFYPPAQHAYQCSICGRACDVACYCHLEEKGVLTKKFKTPFRFRPEWKFPLSDFK